MALICSEVVLGEGQQNAPALAAYREMISAIFSDFHLFSRLYGLLDADERRGKTVIAVSHDDRYFHCADRVVTLEYGKLRSVESTVRSPEHATRPTS